MGDIWYIYWKHLVNTLNTFLTYLGQIWDISGTCLGRIWDIPLKYLEHIWDMSGTYIWDIFGTFLGVVCDKYGTYLGHVWNTVEHILDISWSYLGYFWDTSETNPGQYMWTYLGNIWAYIGYILGISHLSDISSNSGLVHNLKFSGMVKKVKVLERYRMWKFWNGPEYENSWMVLNVKIWERSRK